jgi:hypothetical protein
MTQPVPQRIKRTLIDQSHIDVLSTIVNIYQLHGKLAWFGRNRWWWRWRWSRRRRRRQGWGRCSGRRWLRTLQLQAGVNFSHLAGSIDVNNNDLNLHHCRCYCRGNVRSTSWWICTFVCRRGCTIPLLALEPHQCYTYPWSCSLQYYWDIHCNIATQWKLPNYVR